MTDERDLARLQELVQAMQDARDRGAPEHKIDLMRRLYELLCEINGHPPDYPPKEKAPRH